MGFPLQLKTYSAFGGLRQDISETTISSDFALVAKNCRFRQTGAVRHRDGFGLLIPTDDFAIQDAPILGLHQFKYDGDTETLIAVNGSLYSYNDSTTIEIKTGLEDDKWYSFCSLSNTCYIVNGTENLKHTAISGSTTMSNMSIANPTTALTATANATAGSLSAGIYGYLYTYFNRTTGQESNPFSLSTGNFGSATATLNQSIALTQIPCKNVLTSEFDAINIYRTTVGGSIYDAQFLPPTSTPATYTLLNARSVNTKISTAVINNGGSGYANGNTITITEGAGTNATFTVASVDGAGEVLTISAVAGTNTNYWFATNAATTGGAGTGLTVNITGIVTSHLDGVADTALLDAIQLFHDPAPVFKKVVTHKNKVIGFCENSTTLYISYDFNGWYFPVGTFGDYDFSFPVGKDDGDYIKDIISYIDYLIIFKSNSIHVLEGYDSNDFFLRKLEYDDIGCVGIRASVVKNNLVYFVDRSGIFVTDGNQVRSISKPVQGFFNKENLQGNTAIDKPQISDVCVGVDTLRGNDIIKFSFIPEGGTINSLHLVYNYLLDRWSVDDGYVATSYARYELQDTEYLLRGDDLGFVFKDSLLTYDYKHYTGTTTTEPTELLVIDTEQDFETDELKGLYIYFTSGDFYGKKYRIESNTATEIVLFGTGVEESTSNCDYIIGTSEFIYISGWDDYGSAGHTKRLKFVRPRFMASKNYQLDIFNWYDFVYNMSLFKSVSVSLSNTYDSGVLWNEFTWGNTPLEELLKNTEISKVHKYHAYGIRSFDSTTEVVLNNYDKTFQVKGIGYR